MLVLENVKVLYDGTGSGASSLHRNVDVFLDGARIHQVVPHAAATGLRGEQLERIDCSDLFASPGLIDCHGHVTSLGVTGADLDRENSAAGILYTEKVLYTTLVDGGVTTVRDVGGATALLRRLVDEGTVIGPRLKVAICMLSTTGGHADFRGPDRCHDMVSRLWPPAPGRPSSIVDGPWECRKRVREIAACGADLIKICASPGVASPTDRIENRDFTSEEIAAICDEARGRGLRVAAHAHNASGIRLAIENGVDDIQHASFLDAELMDLASKHGTTVTPTAWVIAELKRTPNLPPAVVDKVERVSDAHARAVVTAAAGGLRILAGTDPVLPGMHGRNYLEIVHLVRSGVSPLAAWFSMTGAAAERLGLDDGGVLAAGKRADLVLYNADVFATPERLGAEAIVEVVKDGVAYRGGVRGLPRRRFADTVRPALLPAEKPS